MRIDNVKVYDIEESIKASKYPMAVDLDSLNGEIVNRTKVLGSCKTGTGHDQFLTGIRVAFDLTCSNKMWVQLQRYKFIDFVSSQSTMHRILKFDIAGQCNEYVFTETILELKRRIEAYNSLEDKNHDNEDVKWLYNSIIYNIPSGFILTARLTTNYRALKTVYHQRKNHKLDEWKEFCEWIERLPYFKELILGGTDE